MLTDPQRDSLRDIARHSIEYGLSHSTAAPVSVSDYADALRKPGASFVTLNINNTLRGCIGTLKAYRPLVQDVAENAYAAAFRDPRFPQLSQVEFAQLQIHISILNPPEAMTFKNEEDLLAQLRPHVDGLVLKDGGHRSTFLPQVWDSLPEPVQFLRHLKQKAGLPMDYWSQSIAVQRYTVEEF